MLESENKDFSSALIGSIGDDSYGKLYKDLVLKEKILPLFEVISHDNTGICCVYCFEKDRGHITDLGASILISEDYVLKNFVI
jgi:sugar/nucleoside kinase (ribokinase family)